MTPESREFVATVRKFGAQFRGFLVAAEELEKIDQLVREGEARLAVLRGEQRDAQDDIDNAHRAASDRIKEKHASVDREIAEKQRKADEALDEAEAQAGRIVAAAREEAAGFAQRAEAHRLSIAALGEEIARLKAEIASHDQDRDRAKSESAAAKQQHEAEKAKLRAFRASLPE